MLSCHLMDNLLSQDHGTIRSGFGISKQAKPPEHLLDTLRMFSQLPSQLTTDRLSLPPEIKASNCGTHLDNASTPLRMSVMMSGFHVFDSHPTHRILSLFLVDGTSL